MALVHGSKPIIVDGLVLCLDAANIKSYSSGTTWNDLSLSANHATLLNGPTYNSVNGGSIVFDNIDDYATVGASGFSLGSSAGTLCAWAKINTLDYDPHWIISYGTPNTNQSRFIGVFDRSYYFGGYGNDINTASIIGPSNYNNWFNLVGVYDGANASIYLNGNLVVGPTAKSWSTVAGNAQIGRQTSSGDYWSGNIAQVSVYNRDLTASEISQNFDALRARFGI